jgi:hypothetical protein
MYFKWIVIKMRKKMMLALMIMSCCAFDCIAAEAMFDCKYLKYSDSSGLRKFSVPLTFQLIWDLDKSEALMKTTRQTKKLKINDSLDFVSFIQVLEGGGVAVTSISKSNGSSVHSLNQFGLSQQAYGICKFSA